jgi:flagellar hook-length control protein FliK
VEIESSFAESVIGNAKSDLAEIAHTLYPDLYETAEDAAADAENFPVSIKLVPMVIVGEKGITVEIPAQMSDTDGLSLSTDEVMETAKILAELNANSLERIQNLLSGQNISIYEAVRALAAVPASATSPTDGVIGINVTEADFLSAESVLSRIAANNPNLQATETIALSDSNKAILEELQAIVKEVIIREAPPTTVSVSVNPLFESRFRERINKLYESTEPDYNDIKVGTTDEKVTFSTDKVDAADEISQSGSNSVRDNPFAAINIRPSAIPVSEIASQPAPFIGTGGEVAPEMQIGNRILEMNTDTDGIQEMTVVLRPRELGEVAVKIVTTAGEVTVTLSAASAETAKILDRNTALLSSQLQDGGVNVKDILTIAPSNASENMGLNFNGESFTSDGNGQGTNGGGNNGRALGEEPLPGEIDGEFTPDDFMQRRMSLWRSV